jgi:hypothetical protein
MDTTSTHQPSTPLTASTPSIRQLSQTLLRLSQALPAAPLSAITHRICMGQLRVAGQLILFIARREAYGSDEGTSHHRRVLVRLLEDTQAMIARPTPR